MIDFFKCISKVILPAPSEVTLFINKVISFTCFELHELLTNYTKSVKVMFQRSFVMTFL